MASKTLGIRFLYMLSILCFCMIPSALGTSYNYGFNVTGELKAKRAPSDALVTTGMPLRSNGSVPVRYEIRDLQKDTDKWTLYILALDLMQYTDQSVVTSWFSIAGIHGVPFQSWNGVSATAGNGMSGYCQHETVLFPTWHRAYVALYEQEVCGLAQYIATLYSGDLRNQMIVAASDCRIPYFDWAAAPDDGEGILPQSVGASPQINVTGPAGTQRISNPLFNYDFKPPDPAVFYDVNPWSTWNSTMRSPTSFNTTAVSNNSAVNENLVTHMVTNQQRLYNLYSNYGNYTMFSNEGWAADTSQYDSLEALHDNIHAMLGGSAGHMTIVPFSAFDPLFFLHHCMVDRVLAIWQGFYPNSWVEPNMARVNSYTTSVGEWLNSSSPLTPFYASSDGTFWNSDMLRDPIALGYTYPELVGISLTNKTSVAAGRSKLAAAVTKLYGAYSSNRLVTSSSSSTGHKSHGSSRFKSRPRYNIGPRSFVLPVDKIISNGTQYREWIANIRVAKQGLDGPFKIFLSLNDGTFIGSMGIFGSPPSIANMMQMAPGAELIASTVPLTNTLIDELADGTISSLDPQVVGPYLETHMLVSVTKGDGTIVDPADVPGLNVTIISSLVEGTSSDEHLPKWGEPDFMLEYK